jgi:hypothetical protein
MKDHEIIQIRNRSKLNEERSNALFSIVQEIDARLVSVIKILKEMDGFEKATEIVKANEEKVDSEGLGSK